MHYKNGKEANNGDLIVTKDWNGKAQVGMLYDTNASAVSCNGMIQRPLGAPNSVTIGDCYLADDAFAAIDGIHQAQPSASPIS